MFLNIKGIKESLTGLKDAFYLDLINLKGNKESEKILLDLINNIYQIEKNLEIYQVLKERLNLEGKKTVKDFFLEGESLEIEKLEKFKDFRG